MSRLFCRRIANGRTVLTTKSAKKNIGSGEWGIGNGEEIPLFISVSSSSYLSPILAFFPIPDSPLPMFFFALFVVKQVPADRTDGCRLVATLCACGKRDRFFSIMVKELREGMG